MDSKRYVLLITEEPESEFAQKICRAALLAGQSVVVEEPTFNALSTVLKKEVGVVILKSEESRLISDYFYKSIRMFHSQTPVIFSTPDMILFDTIGTQKFQKDILVENWAQLISEALEFDREYTLSSQEFSSRVNQIKNLTGDQLTGALEKARSETFGKMKFRVSNIENPSHAP
jgi:hypothetical protein